MTEESHGEFQPNELSPTQSEAASSPNAQKVSDEHSEPVPESKKPKHVWNWLELSKLIVSLATLGLAMITFAFIDRLKASLDSSSLLVQQAGNFDRSDNTLHRNLSLLAVEHVLDPPKISGFIEPIVSTLSGDATERSEDLLARSAIKIWVRERLKNSIPIQIGKDKELAILDQSKVVASTEGSIEIQRILNRYLERNGGECKKDLDAVAFVDVSDNELEYRRNKLKKSVETLAGNERHGGNPLTFQKGPWFYSEVDGSLQSEAERMLQLRCLIQGNLDEITSTNRKLEPAGRYADSDDKRKLIWDVTVILSDLRGVFQDLRYTGPNIRPDTSPAVFSDLTPSRVRANRFSQRDIDRSITLASLAYRRAARDYYRKSSLTDTSVKPVVFVFYQYDRAKSPEGLGKSIEKLFGTELSTYFFFENLLVYLPPTSVPWAMKRGTNQVIYYHSQDRKDAENLAKGLNGKEMKGVFTTSKPRLVSSNKFEVKDMSWWPLSRILPARQLDLLLLCNDCEESS